MSSTRHRPGDDAGNVSPPSRSTQSGSGPWPLALEMWGRDTLKQRWASTRISPVVGWIVFAIVSTVSAVARSSPPAVQDASANPPTTELRPSRESEPSSPGEVPTVTPANPPVQGGAAAPSEGSPHRFFVAADVHASILSDTRDRALLAGTFGYQVRGGYRYGNFGYFLEVEQNMWLTTEADVEVVQGAVNIGVGVEAIYGNGFVRTSLAAGPSILAFDTVLDDAGTTGFFFELRPVGLRWSVHRNVVIGLDPLTFAMVAPVLGGIPLIETEYRTSLYVEGVFE